MFKQFANASIPPPPPPNFPPVPLPNLGFPQFAHNFQPSTPTQFQQQAPASMVQDASDAYDPRFPHHSVYNPRAGLSLPKPQDTQAEGPRQDEESASSRTISQEEQPQGNLDIPGKTVYPSNFDGSVLSTQNQSQEQSLETLLYSERQTSWSTGIKSTTTPQGHLQHAQPTQQPRDATHQLNASEKQAMINPFQQSSWADAQQRPSSRVDESAPDRTPASTTYEAKSPAELRQLAKGALLSLVPHHIKFEHLVKEGIEGQVLRQLFDDLGIKVNEQENPSFPQPFTVTENQAQSEPADTEMHAKGQQPPMAATLTASISAADDGRVQAAVSPSLERKDRIAQLLAAKTGRPSPIRSFSESGASTGPVEARSGNENPQSKGSVRPVDNSMLQDEPGAKSSGVEQAEALKQKMDRLHTEVAGKSQVNHGTMDWAAPSTVVESTRENLQISTQVSPPDAGPLSSIPGLFMTSAEQMRSQNLLFSNNPSQMEGNDGIRIPQKRLHEPDAQHSDSGPGAKRRTIETGEAMDVDRSLDEDDGSEGEVPESTGTLRASANGERGIPASTTPLAAFSSQAATPSASGSGLPVLIDSNPASQGPPATSQAKTRLTSAQIAEKAEMLKARFLKQRAERQKALQDGLPDLDAEVQKTRSHLTQQQAQLSQVRLSIERLNTELVQARGQESVLLEDIAQLEKQFKEGVAGQKEYTDELRHLSKDQHVSQPAASLRPAEKKAHQLPVDATEESLMSRSVGDAQQNAKAAEVPGSYSQSAEASDGEVSNESAVDQTLDAATGEAMLEQAEEEGDSPMYEDATVYAPVEDHRAQETLAVNYIASQDVTAPHSETDMRPHQSELGAGGDDYEDGTRDDSDGSASMSDSLPESEDEEGEYEPDGIGASHSLEAEGSEESEYDPEEMQIEDQTPTTAVPEAVREDEYEPEPAEATDRPHTPSSQMSEEMIDSPPAETMADAPHGINGDGEGSTNTLIEELSTEQMDTITPKAADNIPVLVEVITLSQPPPQSGSAAAAASMPSQATQHGPLTNSAESNGTSHAYAPYNSPLSSFQSFRYSENFEKAAPKDGFRSLTWSNNIDPSVPLCQTELAGGACENPNCEEQHFRHLGLSGKALTHAHDLDS
jgi:Putative zinc-finger domain